MKRKLIDLGDEEFETLSRGAAASGTNLKHYIEIVLDQKAHCLQDCESCYNFALRREPTERELASVMRRAAEAAAQKRRKAEEAFFKDIEDKIKSAK